MKVITIILTTYNSEKTIQRTLNSILNQEGLNKDFTFELIVVDDCSTDNTRKILENNKIGYLSTGKNSGGPNRGRNIGLARAAGDYICIMDHDDEWLPHKIKSQLAVCELAPIVSTGYTEINDSTGKTNEYVNLSLNSLDYILYEKNKTFIKYLTRNKKGQIAYIGSLMFDKSLKDIYFEEDYAMVDFDWSLKLFHNRTSVEICKSLYIRHLSRSNLSLNEKYRNNDYSFSLQTIRQYKDEYPDPVTIAGKRINGTMGRYYYLKEDMKKARKYFLKSEFSLKTFLYLLTSFYGYKFVNRKYKVF
jgi:glycosyltransferase involved in cell wall biosynthesis